MVKLHQAKVSWVSKFGGNLLILAYTFYLM